MIKLNIKPLWLPKPLKTAYTPQNQITPLMVTIAVTSTIKMTGNGTGSPGVHKMSLHTHVLGPGVGGGGAKRKMSLVNGLVIQ